MGLTGLVAVFIPDVPESVKIQVQREKLLAREVLFDTELEEGGAKTNVEKRIGKMTEDEIRENLNFPEDQDGIGMNKALFCRYKTITRLRLAGRSGRQLDFNVYFSFLILSHFQFEFPGFDKNRN